MEDKPEYLGGLDKWGEEHQEREGGFRLGEWIKNNWFWVTVIIVVSSVTWGVAHWLYIKPRGDTINDLRWQIEQLKSEISRQKQQPPSGPPPKPAGITLEPSWIGVGDSLSLIDGQVLIMYVGTDGHTFAKFDIGRPDLGPKRLDFGSQGTAEFIYRGAVYLLHLHSLNGSTREAKISVAKLKDLPEPKTAKEKFSRAVKELEDREDLPMNKEPN